MNFIERGIASITRTPAKTVILLILIFILGNIIAGAISVQQAVKNAESILRGKMSPVVTLLLDVDKIQTLLEQNSEISLENLPVKTIEKIGALPYVKYFDYSIGSSLESRTLNRSDGASVFGPSFLTSFRFQGVNNPDLIDIKEGKIKLVSGRVFNEEEIKNLSYVAIISRSVAQKNNISVGSKIEFENNIIGLNSDPTNNSPPDILSSQKYEFEIIGIFEPIDQVRKNINGPNDADWMDSEMENKIYVSNKVLYEANVFWINEYVRFFGNDYDDRSIVDYTPLYVLKDPLDLEAFRTEAIALMPEYYLVSDASSSFDQAIAPIKSIKDIANLFLYGTIAVTIITLSLLISMFLRDRRRELGIYLSLGEKKVKIAAQIGLEVILIAMIAITLSLFSGNILSRTLSEKMQIDQIVAQADENTMTAPQFELDIRGYQFELDNYDLIDSIEVSLDMVTILLFYIVGIGTICASVLVPIFYITRLNPKKIMMGRQ